MAGRHAPQRLGILLPSSNTVVEPEAARLIPRNGPITLHFSRFRMTVVSGSQTSLDQFAPSTMLSAAQLLADARVDLIAWAGTSASWLGFERDLQLVSEIETTCQTPAVTSVIAINRRLTELGARSIGLVTPYVGDLESRIVANYASIGISTCAKTRLDLTENTAYANVAPRRIADLCRDVAGAKPAAIVVMCTNLRGGPVAGALTRELGIPVLDSVVETVRYCVRYLSMPTAKLRQS